MGDGMPGSTTLGASMLKELGDLDLSYNQWGQRYWLLYELHLPNPYDQRIYPYSSQRGLLNDTDNARNC